MVRLLHEKGIVTDEEVQGLLRRERTRRFTEKMVDRLSKGDKTNEAAIEAVRSALPKFARASDEKCLRRAVVELERPEVCVAIESLFASRGFRVEDAADLHIKHMRGELTKQEVVVVRAGNEAHTEVQDVKIPPNYAAVRDFENSVFPKQATKIESKIAGLIGFVGEGAPGMNARRLAAKDVTPQEERS